MNIRILMLGKNKGSSVEEGVADFSKKLKPFCSLDLVYVKDETVHNDLKKVLQKEQERLLERITSSDFVIVLDEKGKSFDSMKFSGEVRQLQLKGVNSLTFVIGSAHGLTDEIKERANLRLSLSALTMSHQLVRLVLLEQIYRAFTILRGMKYHK